MNGKSLGRSTKSRALSTRVQNISNQLTNLSRQISPIITLSGRNAHPIGTSKTLTIHRKVMTRFVTDGTGTGNFGMVDIGLPQAGAGQALATPLKIKIRGAPLHYLQVKVNPNILSENSESIIGFPSQEQAKICPASLAPSTITIDIPDVYAHKLADLSKLFTVITGPNQTLFISLTYAQVIQA